VGRWLVVGSLLLVLAAPAAWKGLINDWYDGHIDKMWPCSAYREALKRLPESTDTYSSASEDFKRNLREGNCTKTVRVGVWVGPQPGTHTELWPYIAGATGAVLLSATALGMRRARRPTRD
jgi:hypothetical protein